MGFFSIAIRWRKSTDELSDRRREDLTEIILKSLAPITLFPELNPDMWTKHPEWITPGMFSKSDGNILLSLHSWFVETPRHTILVDTGAGNDKDRPSMPVLDHLQEPYLGRLASAGIRPEAVDYVGEHFKPGADSGSSFGGVHSLPL